MRCRRAMLTLLVVALVATATSAQSPAELSSTIRRSWLHKTVLLRVPLPDRTTEVALSEDGFELPSAPDVVRLAAYQPVSIQAVSGDDRSIRFEISRSDGSTRSTVRFQARTSLTENPALTTSLHSAIDSVFLPFAIRSAPDDDEDESPPEEDEPEEEEEEEPPEPVVDRLLVEASQDTVLGDGLTPVTLTISARDPDGNLVPRIDGVVAVRVTSGALADERPVMRGGVATTNLIAPRFSDDLVLLQRSIELTMVIMEKIIAGGGSADPQGVINDAVRSFAPAAPEATVEPGDPWVYVVADLDGVKGKTKIKVEPPQTNLDAISGFYRGRDAAGQPYTLETVPAGDALWAGNMRAGRDTIYVQSFGETKGGFEIIYLSEKKDLEGFQELWPDFKGIPTALMRFPGNTFYIVAPPIIMRPARRDVPESDEEAPPVVEKKPTVSLLASSTPISADGQSTSELVFQYLDADGKPVRGVQLQWKVSPRTRMPDAEKGVIVRADRRTDSNGRATATYRAPLMRGDAANMQEIGETKNRTIWVDYEAPGDTSHVTAQVGLLRGTDIRLVVRKPGVQEAALPIRLSSLNGTIKGQIQLRTSPVEAEVDADYPLEHAQVTLEGPGEMLKWVAFDDDTTDSSGRFTIKLRMKNWPRWDLEIEQPMVVRPAPEFIHAQRLALSHAKTWKMSELEHVDLKIFVKGAQRQLAELEPDAAAGLQDRMRLLAWTLQILKDSRRDAGEALGEMVKHGLSFFSSVAGYCYTGFHLDKLVNKHYKVLETKIGLRNLKLIKARLLKSVGSSTRLLGDSIASQLSKHLLQFSPHLRRFLEPHLKTRIGLFARAYLRELIIPGIVKQLSAVLAKYSPKMPLTFTDLAAWHWLDPYVVRGNQLVHHLITDDDFVATHRTAGSNEAKLKRRKEEMITEYQKVTEWRLDAHWAHFCLDTANECAQAGLKIFAVILVKPNLIKLAKKLEDLHKGINTAAAATEAFVEWWRLTAILEVNEGVLVRVISGATGTKIAELQPLTAPPMVTAGFSWPADGASARPPDLEAALSLDECELEGGSASPECLAGLITGAQLADAWILEQLGPLTSLAEHEPETLQRLTEADTTWRSQLLATKLAAVASLAPEGSEAGASVTPTRWQEHVAALAASTTALQTEVDTTSKRLRALEKPKIPLSEPTRRLGGGTSWWPMLLAALAVMSVLGTGIVAWRLRRRSQPRSVTTAPPPAAAAPQPTPARPTTTPAAPQPTPASPIPPRYAPAASPQPVAAPPPPTAPAIVASDGARHDLNERCTTFGSADDNTVVIALRGVSRHHARIWREDDDRCWIEDTGSTNGTWVDGQQVAKTWLEDGNEIVLGTWRARFRDS